MITLRRITQYRREVSSAGKEAGNYVQAVLDVYRSQHPDASVAQVRDLMSETIKEAVNLYGDSAAMLSNELFNEIADTNKESYPTGIYNSIDTEKVDEKVRYFANSLVKGDIVDFGHSVRDITQYYVKRCAFDNMLTNCKKNKLRYARVPSGLETCAFCFMLASRGFVYHTESDAGGSGHSYHQHCDCIIVPGFHESELDPDGQIEGYKPNELYERYKDCKRAVTDPDGSWSYRWFKENYVEAGKYEDTPEGWERWKRNQLVKEIRTRDFNWLWTGKPTSYSKEKGAKPLKKEDEVSMLLTKHGFNVLALKEINRSHIKTPDVKIQGIKWEYKIPDGWSKGKGGDNDGEQTVRRAFWQASKKADKLVISNVANNVDYYDMWEITKRVFDSGDFTINEVLVVGKNEEMFRLRK